MAKDARDDSGLKNSEDACLAAKGLSETVAHLLEGRHRSCAEVVKPSDILADSMRLAGAGSTVKIELNIAAGPTPAPSVWTAPRSCRSFKISSSTPFRR